MLGRLFRVAVAAALVVAAVGGTLQQRLQGDTNGDQSVDVLDLQALIAQVLEDGANAQSDMNGDGVIDVRDFQELLGQAQESKKDSNQEPKSADQGIILAAKHDLTAQRVEFKRISIASLLEDQIAPRHVCLYTEPASLPSLMTERYVLRLSPHAPPVGA